MTRIVLMSLMLLFFGLASEAKARPFDEAPGARIWMGTAWMELASQEARGSRSLAATGVGYTGTDKYFSQNGGSGVKVDYQCGGDSADSHLANDCLIRVVDTANSIVCYGFAPKAGNYTQNISCVPRPR